LAALTLGALIRQKRQQLNMSQDDLAKYCGITYGAVANWENGTKKPNSKSAAILINALSLTRDEVRRFFPEHLVWTWG
jgi:DNA-binding transcriptional regulator YiaG